MNLKKFSSKGYKKIERGNLEVGDIVIVKGAYGTSIYEIDSATKTMGKCICNEGQYVQRFKIDIWHIKLYPSNTWDTNEYIVYRKENQ